MTDSKRANDLRERALAAGWSQERVDRTRPININEQLSNVPLPDLVVDMSHVFPESPPTDKTTTTIKPRVYTTPTHPPADTVKPRVVYTPTPAEFLPVQEENEGDIEQQISLWMTGMEIISEGGLDPSELKTVQESMTETADYIDQLFTLEIQSISQTLMKNERLLTFTKRNPTFMTKVSAEIKCMRERMAYLTNRQSDWSELTQSV